MMQIIAEIHDYNDNPDDNVVRLYCQTEFRRIFIGLIAGKKVKQEQYGSLWYIGITYHDYYAAGLFVDDIQQGKPDKKEDS